MIGDTSHLSTLAGQNGLSSDGAYRLALDDFRYARKRAAITHLLGRLTGRSLELLSFQEVTDKLKITGQHSLGLQEIPVEAIVGSVGRAGDFSRDFAPLRDSDAQRWAKVKAAGLIGRDLPPIDVYKIGDSYFVSDGNHRVSIARQQGMETIPAAVIEVKTRAPLPPDARPDDLILAAEYADFLEYTRLDKTRPEADIRVSFPGSYNKLENHIALHRCFLEANQAQTCRTVPEAAAYWYGEAYLPVVEAIRERGMLRDFPGWTETDLYLWIIENQEKLRQELGWSVKPASVIGNLADDIGRGSWRLFLRQPKQVLGGSQIAKRAGRSTRKSWMQNSFLDRYSQHLFDGILVSLSPSFNAEPGWLGPINQALVVARREGGVRIEEGAHLLGLAIVESAGAISNAEIQAMRKAFDGLCREAGVDGVLAVETRDVPSSAAGYSGPNVGGIAVSKISERATMADLVVLDTDFLKGGQNQEKGALDMLRALKPAGRPVLFSREWTSPMERTLLVLNETSGIDSTLFLATYLAERWGTELVVLTAGHEEWYQSGEASQAQKYLALHEVKARFLFTAEMAATAIKDTANEHGCDLIVMSWPATGRLFGRPSDDVLKMLVDNCQQPILICP